MAQAAGKHPRNPEAYILAALKQTQSKQPSVEPAPDEPLADWEVQWLTEVHRRQEQQRQREQEREEEGKSNDG